MMNVSNPNITHFNQGVRLSYRCRKKLTKHRQRRVLSYSVDKRIITTADVKRRFGKKKPLTLDGTD